MTKPIVKPSVKASAKTSNKPKAKPIAEATAAPAKAPRKLPATPPAPVTKKSPPKKKLAAKTKPAAEPVTAKLLSPSADETALQERLRRASEIVNGYALTPKLKMFVVEYTKDMNGTQACIRAGYSPRTAQVQASEHLLKPMVKLAIDAIMNDRIDQGIYDGDKIISHWMTLSTANPNALTQYRRLNCRYCWGTDHRYQYTPMEMEEERKRQAYDNAQRKKDEQDEVPFDPIGGIGFRGNRDPNPDCPECFGEGVGRPFFTDTRKLSAEDLPLYKGVKEGKEGIEVMMHSQDDARDKLARHFGLYRDKLAEAVAGNYTKEELEAKFAASMQVAREKQRQIEADRGLEPGGEVDG